MDLNQEQDSSTQQQLIDIMKLMLEEKKEEADLEDIIYFLKNTAERASRYCNLLVIDSSARLTNIFFDIGRANK